MNSRYIYWAALFVSSLTVLIIAVNGLNDVAYAIFLIGYAVSVGMAAALGESQ